MENIKIMKPFYKYTGGKTKEISNIKSFFPNNTKRIVEPFCGSCSVALHFEKPALVADLNEDVITLLQVVQNSELFKQLLSKIEKTNITHVKTEENIKHLERLYYHYRDDRFQEKNKLEKAYRFLLLRQLCFSGMTRVNNKTGKSNVPFGWYGMFQTRLSKDYFNLLQQWDIKHQSFSKTLKEIQPSDWIFIDPPYFQRNSKYEVNSEAGEDEKLHTDLFSILKDITEKWLIIHSDCELYRDLYSNFIIQDKSYFYSQNFKGRGIKEGKVNHLYITNYDSSSINDGNILSY